MELTTFDLYQYTRCPYRFLNSELEENSEGNIIRQAVKDFALYQYVNFKEDLTTGQISRMWDKIFWVGKDFNKENSELSIRLLKMFLKLISSFPDKSNIISSDRLFYTKEGVVLRTYCDFILIDEINATTYLWIYTDKKMSNIVKTIIPAAENFIFQKTTNSKYSKFDVYLTIYNVNDRNVARAYSIKCMKDNKSVLSLMNMVKKKVSFRVESNDLCKSCTAKCLQK